MPGATKRPSASIVFSAAPVTRPISTIVPSLTATSARYREKPLPSTTMPFLITKSWAMTSSQSRAIRRFGSRRGPSVSLSPAAGRRGSVGVGEGSQHGVELRA